MADFDDRLRKLLNDRAGAVDSQLTGALIRRQAVRRRHRLRTVGLPVAAGGLVAAALTVPFLLIGQHHTPLRPSDTVGPASPRVSRPSSTGPVPSTHPSPSRSSRAPTSVSPIPSSNAPRSNGASNPASGPSPSAKPTPTTTPTSVPTPTPTSIAVRPTGTGGS